MTASVSLKNVSTVVETFIKHQIVPMLYGQPGIGKSRIIQNIALKYNLELIDLRLSQCEPTDLLGLPFFKGEKTAYKPMETFPLEIDALPPNKNGWLLFLDELNSASPSVQSACYKLILDRQVGSLKLHPRCAIVAAGNRVEDQSIVSPLSSALVSRMANLELNTDYKDWLDWAKENNIAHQIQAFIEFSPQSLNTFEAVLRRDSEDRSYACPRTWEMISKLIQKDYDTSLLLEFITALMDLETAHQFYAFLSIYKDIPSLEAMLLHPAEVTIPTELSHIFAFSYYLASHLNQENIETLFTVVLRLPIEFQFIVVKQAFNKIRNSPLITEWKLKNKEIILNA